MEYIQDIIDNVRHTIETHKLADGQYARWLWQNASGKREMGVNPYGCADAANTLYMIGDFPRNPAEREKWVTTLQSMQDPETGFFHESTHHYIHTTAHCTAAIELFDAAPLYSMKGLLFSYEPNALEDFLDKLDWVKNPWSQSHQGAGIYVALNLKGEATREWNERYFKWYWDNADPETGLWRKGYVTAENAAPLAHYMAGSFHYLFNHEYAHMPLRYPDKMIDSCIRMYDDNSLGLGKNFGKQCGFMEIDWIFCLTRASRQTPHRYYEVRDYLRDFTKGYLEYFRTTDWAKDESINDLHMLFGSVCAIAELQQTLRGELITDKPLKLVLDRRPFI